MKNNRGKAGEASTRRGFLGGAAATLAGSSASAAVLKPTVSARSASRVVGANDRINLGLIGVGIRGSGHLRKLVERSEAARDVQPVTACDVYTRWKQRAKAIAKLEDKDIFNDYRELLARNDVDAVLIATPDHWHAQMAIDAMAAGKDVYLEKPMTLTISEARQVAEAAAKQGKVLEIGSGGVSDPRNKKARELIEGGEIGDLLWAQTSMGRYIPHGDWNYFVDEEATPETIDWRRWLGSAPKRAFSAERFFRWRKYWDYSGGIATDLYYHSLGPILYAMGGQYPTRVVGAGGIYVHQNREVPDTYATIIEYPKFYIVVSGTQANAAPGKYMPRIIYGSKGTLRYGEKSVVIEPEASQRGRGRAKPEPKVHEAGPYDIWATHMEDFLKCMRTREKPNLDGDLGYRIMVAIRMGVDSYRTGTVAFFDAGQHKVVRSGAARPAYEGKGENYPEEFGRARGE